MQSAINAAVVLALLGFLASDGHAQSAKVSPVDVRVTNTAAQPVPVAITNPSAAPIAPVPVMYDVQGIAGTYVAVAPLVPAGKRLVVRFVSMLAAVNNPNFPLTAAVCQWRRRVVSGNLTTDGLVTGEYKLEPVSTSASAPWTSEKNVHLALSPNETLVVICPTSSPAFVQIFISGEMHTTP